MAKEQLKLGKGAFFVKSQIKRLRQEDETWEADFRALPRPTNQTDTHYLGMVLTQPYGYLLADSALEGTPTVNDLATLLAHAMQRPLVHLAHRPKRIRLLSNPDWEELLPHLKSVGIEVVVTNQLFELDEAFDEYLELTARDRPAATTGPTPMESEVAATFPALAKWVRGYGRVEIGQRETTGFVARALDLEGPVFEDERTGTLA